jgi:hypothetical protein
MLLLFPDVLPICLKGDVKQCIASKQKLCWCCASCSSVHQQVYCPSDCTEDSLPKEVWVEITLVSDIARSNHVANDLMYMLNDGIPWQIPGGDQLALDTEFVVKS